MLINRVWLGSPMPDKFKQYGEEWQTLNPGDQLKDWTDEEVFDTKWINQDVLDNMTDKSKRPGADMIAYYTHIADAICYEIPYRFGGWYFNTDVKPLKPLSTLVYDKQYCAMAYEDNYNLVNMAFYAPEGDAFLGKIIELLPQRYFRMPDMGMHVTTGCGLIMEAYGYNYPVTTFPRQTFNPIHWATIPFGTEPDLEQDFPDSVAVHAWDHRRSGRSDITWRPT